ncbi:hypothetical protein V1279_002958 [Bradyrhizobium sp. AZCC 1610]|uniref:hypothetical protein n=1 Tax=Bradyrhizobium sp. AZCC 1610 TaxID=3117020 RepID=UPI002FF1945F
MAEHLGEANGFREGQRVKMLVEAKGADHEDIEHTMPAGSTGVIDRIERYDNSQGVVFTIWIPVDEADDRGIVNAFDEEDGPISNFISATEEP